MSTDKIRELDIFSFHEVFRRVKASTPINNYNDLKDIIGIAQSAISRRKQQDIWPLEWAVKIALRYGLLTEWLLTGNGPRRLDEVIYRERITDPTLKQADLWLSQLAHDDSRRKDWFAVAFEEAFPMFREWKKRKEREESRDNIDPQSNVA